MIREVNWRSIVYLMLVLVMAACTSNPKGNQNQYDVRFYRNLLRSQTPFDLEKGIHPLSSRKAKTINNYKFSFDEKGRMLSVEYVRNSVLLGYSSMGFAAKVTYEYSEHTQTKYFFSNKNEPIEDAGVFKAEYTLDTNGIRKGLAFFGKYGEPVENKDKIHSFKWEILPDGMVQELRYDLTGKETVLNPFCPFYELRFSYNEKGYVTRMANYEADTLYNCMAENCGEVGVSYFLFDYNNFGDVLQFSVFNASGLTSNVYWGWSKRINKFDRHGYVVETEFFDQDDEYIGGKRVPVIQYFYDRHWSGYRDKKS